MDPALVETITNAVDYATTLQGMWTIGMQLAILAVSYYSIKVLLSAMR